MKKMLAMLVAGCMIFSMMACGGSSDSKETSGDTDSKAQESTEAKSDEGSDAGESGELDTSKLSIGVVMKLYDEFQNKVIDGAEDAAKEIGAKDLLYRPG